jgi:ribosomal protein L11 methyltransferase
VRLGIFDAKAPLPRTARITVANILANPLRMLAPLIAAHTEPGGSIALSGILSGQEEDVIEAYRPWAKLQPAGSESGWVLLAGIRGA